MKKAIEQILNDGNYPKYIPSYVSENGRQVQGYQTTLTSYKKRDAYSVNLKGSSNTKKFIKIKEDTFDSLVEDLKVNFGFENIFVYGTEIIVVRN